MKMSVLVFALATALFTAACGDDRNNLRRDQQEYDVVQEGAGGTVSSTLQVPGEVAPLPPLTGTNADTTSAFTLPTTTDPTQSGPPGTIAGTFPTGTGGGSMPSGSSGSPNPSTRPVSRPAPTPQPQPVPTQTREPEPMPAPEPQPTTTQEPREEELEPEPEPEPQPRPEPQPPPPPPPSSTNP